MNEKQRAILEGLHKHDDSCEEWFRLHYKELVKLEINKLSSIRIGWLIQDDLINWIKTDRVLAYFILIARAENLTKSILTIEQMLHLVIIDLLPLDYRYLPSIGLNLERLAKLRAGSFIYLPNEWEALGDRSEPVVANANLDLTPELLSGEVVPCIEALTHLQFISEQMRGHDHKPVVVRLIRQRSPLDVNLEGLSEAIDSLKEDIIPWRRRNAQRLADLKAKENETEIEKKKAEVSQLRAASRKDKAETVKISVEADSEREEVARRKLENEKLRFDLESSKVQLALDIVSRLRPELSDQQKLVYAFEMLPSISKLATTELEFGVVERRALSEGEEQNR